MSSRRKSFRRMSGRLPAPLDMKGIDENDVDAAMSSLSVSKENTPMAANDDALEREKRKQKKRRERRRRSGKLSPYSIVSTPTAATTDEGETQQKYTQNELSALYKSTVQLSSENKINKQNSWSLQFIDQIDQIINVAGKGSGSASGNESRSFQNMGVVVETSAKIYAARVEETYLATGRFVADLTRVGGDDEEEDDASTEGGDAEGSETTGAKGQKKKKGGVICTLEKNLANISMKSVDMEYDVDPMFSKMSQKFDEGGAKGMLLNHLTVEDGCSIVFDTTKSASAKAREVAEEDCSDDDDDDDDDDDEEEDQDKDEDADMEGTRDDDSEAKNSVASPTTVTMVDVSGLIAAMKATGIDFESETSRLCPGLDILHRDMDRYQHMLDGGTLESISAPPAESAPAEFNAEMAVDGGYDCAENSTFDDEGWENMETRTRLSLGGAEASGRESQAFDVAALAAAPVNDYAYFDQSSFKKANWAGPVHWKPLAKKRSRRILALHARQQDAVDGAQISIDDIVEAEEDAEGSGTGKRKSRKKVFRVDFFSGAIDASKEFAEPVRSRKATLLSDKAVKEMREDTFKFTLPQDVCYEARDLGRLFLRPQSTVMSKPTSVGSPMDSPGDDGNMPGDDGGDVVAEGSDAAATTAGGLGFVDNHTPDGDSIHGLGLLADEKQTEKIEIGYATTRTKFDIKSLKKTMWSVVEKDAPVVPHEEAAENATESDGATADSVAFAESADEPVAEADSAAETPASLRETMDKLADKVPETSVSVMFFCMLYLANEKGLKLEGDANLSDVRIRRTIDPEAEVVEQMQAMAL